MSFPDNKLTVRSPGDFVAAVPYLLGFHPADGSVVVIAVRDGRVVFAARCDLPAADAPTQHLLDLVGHLVPVLRRQQPINDLVLTGYGEADHVDAALRTIDEVLTGSGMVVREVLRVAGTRFFNLVCHDPACCSPEGIPFDPSTSLVAVQATAAGMVALPDRAAIAARFAPVSGAARDAIQEATRVAIARLQATENTVGARAVEAAGAQALREALRDRARRLTDDEVAWLSVLLTRTSVRDLAVQLTEPHDRHVTLWVEVTRRADEALVPAPATVLAIAAWRCGDGALAGLAAERALQVNPDYQLAGLVLEALRVGLPPSTFA
ncbi:DUF4192 domain-containing protein [Micromonospora sp. WMMA1923]|uniref:DUF4192 domain-containing protein n=1 Tax=Micromonospora sp. WMMA1923 TaxID=3404125 RepID=UPI003B95ABCB